MLKSSREAEHLFLSWLIHIVPVEASKPAWDPAGIQERIPKGICVLEHNAAFLDGRPGNQLQHQPLGILSVT